MKTRIFAGGVVALFWGTLVLAGMRDEPWKAVDKAIEEGLPKTAIEALKPIIAGAMADGAHAEAVKALVRKIALEGTIEGNKPEEKIVRLQAEIAKVPAAMKPVMEAILAHWYWQYFQENRWRFFRRTETAEVPGPDIQTWDLPRIMAEIGKHFTAALADEATLKATPVAAFDDLLEKGSVPDAYRPTMFDFLAHEALSFYTTGEQAGMEAEDAFELRADSAVFDDADVFLAWHASFATKEFPDSSIVKALDLFGRLLAFHRNDRDRSAFLDVDLERLVFGGNVSVGEDKDARCEAALERFIEANAKHEVSSRALAVLARRVKDADDPARAHKLATRGLEAFPKSAGGAMCFNLIQEIEAREVQIETERVWNAPWPTLDVTYRNITKVHFRAVPVSFEKEIERSRWGFGRIDGDRLAELLATKPSHAWSSELPAKTDFRERTEKLPAPEKLAPGYYVILASHDPAFGDTDNMISATFVWVSNLALVVRSSDLGGKTGGLVLDARTGEPIAGAKVRTWRRNREGWHKPAGSVTTDANGRFENPASSGQIIMLAEHGGEAVASEETWGHDRSRQARAATQTIFFTDRALYRPGQTIQYKGVSIRFDQAAGNYSADASRALTVVFNDPNGKEIARAEHRTNDYGSFSGTFTAPRDRLTGRMTIQVLNGQGATSVSVEEYKRPKFQVALEAPAEAAKLGDTVHMTGKATAYTGAAIGGAKVKWHVQRGVQLPRWCWWWQPPNSKAIAHGTAVTEPDGTFAIEFPAEPDRSVPEKNEPVFVYEVYADVTDTTGETRSDARAVSAGYTALRATLLCAEWQTQDKPVELAITTQSLDGDPQAATGKMTIHALEQPTKVKRTPLQRPQYWWNRDTDEPPVDPSNPDSWELGKAVAEQDFSTDASGTTRIAAPLVAGIYRALLETKDRFGRTVAARTTVQVVDPAAKHYGVKLPSLFTASTWSVEPGQTFTALWGTGYETGRAFVELECNGKPLRTYWTAADRTQARIELPVSEAMRGGFTLRVTYVRENRAYLETRVVDVPWSNKQLAVKWESFRSKLVPGQPETWTATVTGPEAKRATAEMVAALYDASLDQYLPHHWPQGFGVFRQEYGRSSMAFQNGVERFDVMRWWTGPDARSVEWVYRSFSSDMTGDSWGGRFYRRRGAVMMAMASPDVSAGISGYGGVLSTGGRTMLAMPAPALGEIPEGNTGEFMKSLPGVSLDYEASAPPPPPAPDLSKVTARKNLNETAFFFPHLMTDDEGVVKIQFTMPEALTQWKFLGFAHDAQLRAGLLTDTVVTAKDIMVEPNPPRFVREGDAIEFTVKVSNRTDQPQAGKVRLTFADAASLASVDAALGNTAPEQAFEVPAKQSRTFAWRVSVPDGMGFLTYKAVGASASASDGEEGFLPVLSRRILVTESLPLPVRGKGTREFEFKKLLDSGTSDTLRHQSLTVQMVSQPAWYAVMALPYLMEYPYECSEQVFNRLYANALARHIANADPKIRRVFDVWKNSDPGALDSPLEKNADLKSVQLEETPWLRQAKSESAARRNVGLLFDANRLDEETSRLLHTLSERQLDGGLWSWFPGGRPSEYISLYIVMGFGRLRHLGAEVDAAPAFKALEAVDAWMDERYQRILEGKNPDDYVPGHLDAIYLYARSFFIDDKPVAVAHRKAVNFYLRQATKLWLRTDCRMCQAQIAIALQRFGDADTPQAILRSLKERSVSDPELGMFWRDTELSWWWYRAPIETQATMIEAFDEVAHDAQAVEDCKVWLLKQKQTQDWKTTKATADAVYALLLRGENLLGRAYRALPDEQGDIGHPPGEPRLGEDASPYLGDALVEVALGGETIHPDKVEAGTGFYEQRFVRGEIKPAMGEVKVTKVDDGVSWGSVHWQYLEDMAKVTPHEGTPLRLNKTLYVKETTASGPVLKPVSGPLAVGDELVVRIELRTDRDMEFVHLKDQRGSGTEPVNVLSRYRYQDGLAYYESTRDTASHFFIDYLPKGTYVFEYSTRVQLRGRYQSGIAEIQCMYAPEFNSHSESVELEVE